MRRRAAVKTGPQTLARRDEDRRPRRDARWLVGTILIATVVAGAAGCTTTTSDVEEIAAIDQALVSGFRLPFECGYSTTITQGNNSPFSHNGQSAYGFDFGVPLNTQLVAARAGKVIFARNDVKPGNPCYSGGGPSCANTHNYVTIDHGDDTSTVYAHMNSVSVKVGATVAQGQPIGLSGGTGYSTGAHTHVQRQTKCGAYYCQSIPMSFDDVPGNGVPSAGQAVTSQNGCTPDADCALGNGDYCGGNGVKGDPGTLFRCTAATPKAVEKCAYGCMRMPPGKNDRCKTASEADDASDAGADGSTTSPISEDSEDAARTGPPSGESAPDADRTPSTTTSAELEPAEASTPEAASCAIVRTTSARSAAPLVLLGAALVFAARRRRRTPG